VKVFISSVMKGFESYRQSAKSAVELLSHHPVMAEDFGARPDPPESACLAEVRESDVYILILGERYGWTGASNTSPTEQEYDEAVRNSKPILAFISLEDKEDRQKQFGVKVGDYNTGVFRATFTNAVDLRDQIIRALSNHERSRNVRQISANEACERFETFLMKLPQYSGETITCLSCIPVMADINLSVTEIGSEEFANELIKELLLGKSKYFESAVGYNKYVDETHIIITQKTIQSEVSAILIMDRAGQIMMGKTFPERQDYLDRTISALLVDQDATHEILYNLAGFAGYVYQSILNYRNRIFVAGSILNMGMKSFGKHSPGQNRVNMYMGTNDRIISVPAVPELSEFPVNSQQQSSMAHMLLELFIRRFSNEGRII